MGEILGRILVRIRKIICIISWHIAAALKMVPFIIVALGRNVSAWAESVSVLPVN